jgi:hypothetical protein
MAQYFPGAISNSRGANVPSFGPGGTTPIVRTPDKIFTSAGGMDVARALGVGVTSGLFDVFQGAQLGDKGMLSRVAISAGSEIAADLVQGYIPPVGPNGMLGKAAGPVMSGAMYTLISGPMLMNSDGRSTGMRFLQQAGSSAVYEVIFGRGNPSTL